MSNSSTNELRQTTLFSTHVALGGNMVDFGGWEMPLWYSTGAIKEHMAVIRAAGLFDTSHMSVVLAKGETARGFLNYALTRDISGQRLERCGYSAILTEEGFCLDDTIIYPLAENFFALVVNAGMGGKVIAHMRSLPGGDCIQWQDLTGQIAKLDIQGPLAYSILRPLVKNPEQVFESFPYFSFKGTFDFPRSQIALADGTPVLLSRTGYTGEAGFEIYLSPSHAQKAWEMLLEAGTPHGLIPCGLAARDSLRAGAVLALSHQDIGNWPFINHPWPWALPFTEDGSFSKDFFGRKALEPAKTQHTLAYAGFDPRKVDTHDARAVYNGKDVGSVLTCVADMAIGRVDGKIMSAACPPEAGKPENFSPRGLVCGFVKVEEKLEPGAELILKDGRREIRVEITEDIRPCRTARKKLDSMI